MFDLAEQFQVLEAALEHAVKTGFVTIEEMHVGRTAKIGEGAADTAEVSLLRALGRRFFEEVGFDGYKTALTPDG